MSRLVYGILSLIIGSMALLLPETKKLPLPRTMIQVEIIPTSISKKFRRHRSLPAKRNVRPDGARAEASNAFNDAASSVSGVRSVRFGPYDNQSTLHSVYELQEFGQDDTIYSGSNRCTRRTDSRNLSLFQPYSGNNADNYRQQQPIAEVFDEDVDDDRTRYAQQQRLNEQHQLTNVRADDEPNVVPVNEIQSPLDVPVGMQSGDGLADRYGSTLPINDDTEHDENRSQSSAHAADKTQSYRPDMNDDGNYFSEHC
jgi:hypothetical protein